LHTSVESAVVAKGLSAVRPSVRCMDDEQSVAAPDQPLLPPALEAVRDALVQLRSEDLQSLDSAGLLADVADLHTLLTRVEGEWLRRVGEVHLRGDGETLGARLTKASPRGCSDVAHAVD